MANERKKGYNYQYDSVARAYEQPLVVSPSPKLAPPKHPQRAIKRKLDLAFGMKLSCCGLILFTSAFLYINSYASLRFKQNELISLKNEMITVKSLISEAEAKLAKTLNLEYIRQRAAEELNMKEPLPHQIVYIELPEQSYTSYGK